MKGRSEARFPRRVAMSLAAGVSIFVVTVSLQGTISLNSAADVRARADRQVEGAVLLLAASEFGAAVAAEAATRHLFLAASAIHLEASCLTAPIAERKAATTGLASALESYSGGASAPGDDMAGVADDIGSQCASVSSGAPASRAAPCIEALEGGIAFARRVDWAVAGDDEEPAQDPNHNPFAWADLTLTIASARVASARHARQRDLGTLLDLHAAVSKARDLHRVAAAFEHSDGDSLPAPRDDDALSAALMAIMDDTRDRLQRGCNVSGVTGPTGSSGNVTQLDGSFAAVAAAAVARTSGAVDEVCAVSNAAYERARYNSLLVVMPGSLLCLVFIATVCFTVRAEWQRCVRRTHPPIPRPWGAGPGRRVSKKRKKSRAGEAGAPAFVVGLGVGVPLRTTPHPHTLLPPARCTVTWRMWQTARP